MWTTAGVVAAGIAAGLIAAVGLEAYVQNLLHGIRARDPWVLGAPIGAMLVFGLVAAAGPAIRALRTDPAETLRAD